MTRPAALRQVLRAIRLVRVRSSAVEQVGYDPEARMVAVVFAGGETVYGYPGLSDAEVEGLIAVLEKHESLGHYIATVIKPAHDHERVQL